MAVAFASCRNDVVVDRQGQARRATALVEHVDWHQNSRLDDVAAVVAFGGEVDVSDDGGDGGRDRSIAWPSPVSGRIPRSACTLAAFATPDDP